MSVVTVVGPSHIHQDYMSCEWQDRFHKANISRIAAVGPPNFSYTTLDNLIAGIKQSSNLVWMVIDWRIGNYDVYKIKKSNYLWYDTPAKPNNIDAFYINKENDDYLINHQFKVIDYVIKRYPDIRILFWCLYYRTKVCQSSSLPSHGLYDNVVERYHANSIDLNGFVQQYVSSTGQPATSLYKDQGGHPSDAGYQIMLEILNPNK